MPLHKVLLLVHIFDGSCIDRAEHILLLLRSELESVVDSKLVVLFFELIGRGESFDKSQLL